MYIIECPTFKRLVKLVADKETAEKVAKQLSAVFDKEFVIREVEDVWSVNYNQ